jgi:uncharacterized protein YecA (UPF0149 family)
MNPEQRIVAVFDGPSDPSELASDQPGSWIDPELKQHAIDVASRFQSLTAAETESATARLNELAGQIVSLCVHCDREAAYKDREGNPVCKLHRYISIAPIRNAGTAINRNDLCGCGSGKKFKKCCMRK